MLITNANLGGDPQPGVFKFCVVEYRTANESDQCLKRRLVNEGTVMDFSWDIVSLEYGPRDFKESPGVYEKFFQKMMADDQQLIVNEIMEGDPAPGMVKECEVIYSWWDGRERKYYNTSAKEGGWIKFKAHQSILADVKDYFADPLTYVPGAPLWKMLRDN